MERQEQLKREEMKLKREELDRLERFRQEDATRQDRLIETQMQQQQQRQMPKPHLKMPVLRDSDDIEDFLQHFDAIAEQFKLTDQEKILHLSGSLTDKARQAYVSMPSGSTYSELQDALRRRFYLTPEAYRRKFREAKKQSDESFTAFGERILRYKDSWCKMADASFDQLILIEQLCNGVSPELVTRIREKKPKTFSEALTVAEDYADARRSGYTRPVGLGSQSGFGQDRSRDKNRNRNFDGQRRTQSVSSFNNNRKPWQQQQHQQRPQQPRNRDLSGIRCFHCDKFGHLKKECRSYQRVFHSSGNAAQANKDESQPRLAFCQARNASLALDCEDSVDLPTFFSEVEGHVATTIRDSGATHVFVDQRLVPDSAPRGPIINLTGIEKGFQQRCQKVLINVTTPYYQGQLWAVALDEPICDLLIGNHIDFLDGSSHRVSTDLPKGVCAAVMTQAATRRAQQQVLHPVLTPFPNGITLNVTQQDIQRKQHDDRTLNSVRAVTDQPAKPGSSSRYVTDSGILYRIFSKGTQQYRQLVVPKCLRETVLKMGHDMPIAGHLGCHSGLM
ncbi:hypothetical protein ACOMHN_049152 [Nucella lapillus]